MLDIKIGSVLLGYSLQEQTQILDCVYGGEDPKTKRIEDAGRAIVDIIMNHEEIVEGYAGFPVEKKLIDKNKIKFDKDRNIGRVISQGGESFVITGMKNDGRYQIMGKKGEKTAKEPRDLGLNLQRPGGVTEGIDIDALHNEMVESLKQARKNVGAGKCWDGYTAKGTKKKGGKVVPNCVKDHHEKDADGNVIPHDVTDPKKSLDEKKGLWDNIHAKRKRGEKPAKPGDKDYPKTLNVEGMKAARKNVGASTCWKGYKAKGTKMKGGKKVPNCVKEFSEWRRIAEKK